MEVAGLTISQEQSNESLRQGAPIGGATMMTNTQVNNPGGYDLAELRKKLEQRMEYSKVATLPHDPNMDPDESIPSYASSHEV